VTIGVGRVCRNIVELSQSYSNAREAVSYRVIYGASRSININEIAPREMNGQDMGNEKELAAIFKMIRLGSKEDIVEAIRHYLDRLQLKERSLQQYHLSVMEFVGAVFRFASNNNIVVEELSRDIRSLYSKLLDMERDELQKWCVDISLQFHEKLFNERNRSSKSFISRAQDYVHSHYADETLSLDDICGELGISNSYFSTIFKKDTGKSFVGYLTDYRLDRAAQMLLETNEKSYIIAKRVGYTDPNYFSYVFKRKFGVSPSKYRMEQAEIEN
jgi:two-component system response regulator YesN